MNDRPLHPYKNSLGEHIISGIPNDVFDLNKFDINSLYFNEMFTPNDGIPENPIYRDGIKYRENKHGYRSPEFSENTDFLISGCSFTYGIGVAEEDLWVSVFSSKLGVTYANLSMAGNSVGKIVRDIFAYFKNFGHPKNIICLFPPFERIEIPINDKLITINGWNEIKNKNKNPLDEHNNEYIKSVQLNFAPDLKTIDKKPYLAENTIPTDMAHFYAAQQILILEQYCQAVDINFKYGFWNPEQNFMIKKLNSINNKYYKNFIDVGTSLWRYNKDSGIDELYENEVYLSEKSKWGRMVDCHLDLREKSYTFDLGADRQNGNINAHWGSHRHMHIAEAFYKYVTENGFNNE